MKRERDRLSSRYEALTQECHETQEHAANHQRELQHTCDENLNQCNTRIAKFERDATTCHNSLLKSSKDLSACNNEVSQLTIKPLMRHFIISPLIYISHSTLIHISFHSYLDASFRSIPP